MKLWPITTGNKCFCENVVILVGWICKSYSTFGLFNMYCSSLFLFFIFIFSQSSICALFSTVFLHCSYIVFHCSSTVPFLLATLSFFFFFLVLNSSYSTKRHCSYSSYFFFFFLGLQFVLFFFLLYISLYIQCFCDVHLQYHFIKPLCFFF